MTAAHEPTMMPTMAPADKPPVSTLKSTRRKRSYGTSWKKRKERGPIEEINILGVTVMADIRGP